MKDVYFKSFGYKIEKKPVFGCMSIFVEYDIHNNIIDSQTSTNLYNNVSTAEEANVLAGFDAVKMIVQRGLVKNGDNINFCSSSNIINSNANAKLSELLNERQKFIAGHFNSYLSNIRNQADCSIGLISGIPNRRTLIGYDLLSAVEDILIEKIQSKIVAKDEFNIARRNEIDAKIKVLKSENKIYSDISKRMNEGDFYTKGSRYDSERGESLSKLFHANSSKFDAEALYKRIVNDQSFIPSYHRYY